ncbi:MAG: polysaccharide deacetylase family protein [Actinobacteria bacterium]|nr:polysaccharide deacetylase family protein [Actinomycetota bacterium]
MGIRNQIEEQINGQLKGGIPERPLLTWPEIIEMSEYGCEFLSHSINHLHLGLVSDEEFLYELIESKKDIESHLGKKVLFFAWPYDNFSYSKWRLISQAGYRGAVRYGTGIEDLRTINLYDIKRVEFNSLIPPWNYAGYLKLYDFEIESQIDSHTKKVNEEFEIYYFIRNIGRQDEKISSIELELPEGIKFVGVSQEGDITQMPGINKGIYMWVSDSYVVRANSGLNLIIKLKGIKPIEEGLIKLRFTSGGSYIEAEDVEVTIVS